MLSAHFYTPFKSSKGCRGRGASAGCYFKYANKRTGPEQWPFDEDFHLILNVAIGGTWGGRRGIDDAAFPCAMELAFVKVFQRQPPDS